VARVFKLVILISAGVPERTVVFVSNRKEEEVRGLLMINLKGLVDVRVRRARRFGSTSVT
jgi:hypothetical protein